MRVGVDARHLAGGRGVAHYTSELLTALAREFPGDEWRAFVPGGGPLVGNGAADVAARSGVRVRRHRLPSRVLFGAAALAGRPKLDALLGGGLDAVWIPAPAPVAISAATPYVLTVHDLSWLERPQDFTPYERLWHRVARLERLAAKARVVVAVSEATRDAIAEHWPGVGDVRVVRSGIPALPPPAPRPDWLPARYVLAVGALEPRKAPDELASAWAEARRRGLEAELVFAGAGRLAPQLERTGARVVHVDRATIATLYEHALAVALPSHLEGFGFTALEAARAGVPVLASDLPAIVETLGDAALAVARGEWADALLRIERDAPLRARLATAGRDTAAGLSWTQTARAMHEALEDAAR